MKKLCDIVVVSDRHIYNEARSSKGGNENVRDSSDRQDSSTAADRSDGHRGILPLIVLTAIAGFLFNLATDLSGYVIGPALLLILGFDIYFLITTQWIHVAILTMLGAGCLVVLFGQAVVIVALEGARDGLIRFMRS